MPSNGSALQGLKLTACAATCVLTLFAIAQPNARAGITVNLGKLVLDAGADYRTTRQLEVSNSGDRPAEIRVFAADWKQDENGAVEAIESVPSNLPDSATAWIGVSPQRFTLQKGERKMVTISVGTPKAAGAMPLKEYRSMIFTETSDAVKPPNPSADRELQVHVVSRIGTKVFLRNPKVQTKLDCEVTKMEEVTRDGRVGILIESVNKGNVHIQSDNSTIAFRDASGATVESYPLNSFSILPGHTRSIFFELPTEGKARLRPGARYNALAVIDYGGPDLVAGEMELTY